MTISAPRINVTLPCHTSIPFVGTAFAVPPPSEIAAQLPMEPNAISAPPITVSRNPHRRSGLGFTTASIDGVCHSARVG